jgi:hypothetical protein
MLSKQRGQVSHSAKLDKAVAEWFDAGRDLELDDERGQIERVDGQGPFKQRGVRRDRRQVDVLARRDLADAPLVGDDSLAY